MWNDSNNQSTTHLGVVDTPLPGHLYDQPEEAKLQVLPSTAPLAQAQRSNRPTVLLSLALVISLLLAVGGSYLGYNLGLERGRIEGSQQVSTAIYPIEFSMLRVHNVVAVGSGPLREAIYSDGAAPHSDEYLHKHYDGLQRIWYQEQTNGCDRVKLDSNKVWFVTQVPAAITVNGQEVASINVDTPPDGYSFDWKVKVGDQLCMTGGKGRQLPAMFYLWTGDDVPYWQDSHCYRGNCNVAKERNLPNGKPPETIRQIRPNGDGTSLK